MMVGIVALVLGTAPAEGRAAFQTEWHPPFANAAAGVIAVADGTIYFTDFDGQAGITYLGSLDPSKGNIKEMRVPYYGIVDMKVRPTDGALFLADISASEIALADLHQRRLRRWALPALAIGGPRSLTFDDQGRVLFLVSSFVEKTAVGRLDTTTDTVEFWQLPDSIGFVGLDTAWQLVRADDGSVFLNLSGFTHNELVRLDLTTGVPTAWQTPTAPVFGLATDGIAIYFQEYGSSIRNVARLVPATGVLTEWAVPPVAPGQDVEFSLNLTQQGGRLFFGLGYPPGLGELDPASPGADSTLAPFVADPVAPLSFVVTPSVTVHPAHPRNGHARPTHRVPASTTMGPFQFFETGNANWVVGDGLSGVYFNGGTRDGGVVHVVP
jgi:streptogramin lyase